MGETDVHRNQILDLIHGLEMHYLDRGDVYVSGNLLMLYQEGAPNKHLSPDVLVVLNCAKHERDNFLIWAEGKAPDFIIEVTSKSTRAEDLGTKKGLYALVGVLEYYIFDPLREYLKPGLRAYRLEGEDYLPVLGETVTSQVLGLELRVVENRLRLVDLATSRMLPTRLETELARKAAQQALEQTEQALEQTEQALAGERQARDQAETRAAAAEREADRLRRELKNLRGS